VLYNSRMGSRRPGPGAPRLSVQTAPLVLRRPDGSYEFIMPKQHPSRGDIAWVKRIYPWQDPH